MNKRKMKQTAKLLMNTECKMQSCNKLFLEVVLLPKRVELSYLLT